MKASAQLAKHLREVYFGGNWTTSCLRQHLSDVSWELATKKIYSLNTIATLAWHINYYVSEVTKVLEGQPLQSKDEYSFNHPPVHSQDDWEEFLSKMWADGEKFARLIERLPDEKLWEDFTDRKYGIYYRNIFGIIEHAHYHLGQIVIVKKILSQSYNSKGPHI